MPHAALNAFVGDSGVVVIQPSGRDAVNGNGLVESLSVDLNTGSVQQLLSAPQRMAPIPICAVLGIVRLFKGKPLCTHNCFCISYC